MNSLKQFTLLCLTVFLTYGCNDSLKYKYDAEPILVSCQGADSQLLNEALYSFFDDIEIYYGTTSNGKVNKMDVSEAYANFIFKGANGEADYGKIVSPHSLKVLEKLKKEKELWLDNSKGSRLDYNAQFVSCLISNIEDKNIKITIKALKDTGNLNPKIISERLRLAGLNALSQPNFIMYIALDTYYQYLLDLDI